LVTSPYDQERIFSGEAREMRIDSKSLIVRALSEKGELLLMGRNPSV
jgi:hypothetical protein